MYACDSISRHELLRAVRWGRMLHVAVYGGNYQIGTELGGSRPDLIGLSTNGDWFVFEAKGRSNAFEAEALETAKEQAEQITTIDDAPPVCRVASQSFFSSDGLRFRMDDPKRAGGGRTRAVKISRDAFEHTYYDSLRSIIASRGTTVDLNILGRRFRGTRIGEADIVIALVEQGPTLASDAEKGNPESEYLGKDGVLVRLGSSWSHANMRLQPHLRSS